MRYPVSSFASDFSVLDWLCNDRIALTVVLSKWVLQVFEHEIIPFFHSFCGKDGGDPTRDLTVHNFTSCLRRHCEEVDRKCYATNATTSFCLLNSFFHHTGVRKRGTSIKNTPQLMLPRLSHGHIPVPLKRMFPGRQICLHVTNQYTPTIRILFTVCWTDSSAGIVNIWLASTIQSASRHLCLRHGRM